MAPQIAVRIPDEESNALDDAVATGEFESKAAAVREGIRRLLSELRERRIAEEYRQAYAEHPQEPEIGEAGLLLAAEIISREEAAAA